MASMEDDGTETISTAMNSLSVLSVPLPVLICLFGSPGAGKTSIGKALEVEFPSRCCFVSVGEEMRGGSELSAIDIIRKAIIEGRDRGCQYVIADAQFSSQNLLELIDLEQSNIVSMTLALIIDTKREDCEENMRRRQRKDDIIYGRYVRIEQWTHSSRDAMRVINSMGANRLKMKIIGLQNDTLQKQWQQRQQKLWREQQERRLSERQQKQPRLDYQPSSRYWGCCEYCKCEDCEGLCSLDEQEQEQLKKEQEEQDRQQYQKDLELACKEAATSALVAFEAMEVARAASHEVPVGYHKGNDLEAFLMSILCVHSINFAMPVALENASDLKFVEINDYKVSHKADGIRAWVFTFDGQVYSRRRDGSFRKLQFVSFPPGIVVDAEIMTSEPDSLCSNSSIIAFDILAVEGKRIWHQNLDARLAVLRAIPGIRFKEHFPLGELRRCIDERDSFSDFESDGLVFTPNVHYCFDGAIPLYKWQRPHEITFDFFLAAHRNPIRVTSATLGKQGTDEHYQLLNDVYGTRYRVEVRGVPSEIDHNGIAVCSYSSHTPFPENLSAADGPTILIILRFDHLRFDKLTPNAASTIMSQLQLCVSPLDLSTLNPCLGGKAQQLTYPSKCDLQVHPAKALEFSGTLSSYLESSSDIEIVQNGPPGLGVVNCTSPIADPHGIARGLVVDMSVCRVVAMSFPRFPHRLDSVDDKIHLASVKLDGSMILAYKWKGELVTSTKRRHDSEQAVMAKHWLQRNSNIDMFNISWTYVFEAIFSDNYLVLPYHFDSLVLITAFDSEGFEIVDAGQRCHIAELLNVPLTPRVFGTIEMLKSPNIFGRKEGWVIEEISAFGQVTRSKIVTDYYKKLHTLIGLLRPELVWRSVGEKQNINSLFARSAEDIHYILEHLPIRYKEQWDLMESAILKSYSDELDSLKHSTVACTICGCFAERDSDGERICFCDPCIRCGCDNIQFKNVHVHGQILKINQDSTTSCLRCGCSAECDSCGDRLCFCDPCIGRGCEHKTIKIADTLLLGGVFVQNVEVAGVTKEMIAFARLRPQDGVVQGYTPPLFLKNNFAKGWKGAILEHQLWWQISKYNTFEVMAALDISSICTMRLTSRYVDFFIRSHFSVYLEQAHTLFTLGRELQDARGAFDADAFSSDSSYGRRRSGS